MKTSLTMLIILILLLVPIVNSEEEIDIKCIADWTCSDWSACLSGFENRTCSDTKFCGGEEGKPLEYKVCQALDPVIDDIIEPSITTEEIVQIGCVENWKCAPWSRCNDEEQTRKCFDENACNTEYSRPIETQTCTEPKGTIQEITIEPQFEEPSNLLIYIYTSIGLILVILVGITIYRHFSVNGSNLPNKKFESSNQQVIHYINQMRAAGYTNQQIRNELTNSGYGQEEINQHFLTTNSQLKQFTKQMLEKGYNLDQIEDHLLTHGHEYNMLQEHFKEIKEY